MGTLAADHAAVPNRKPRLLCLHGFRTSGEIMRKQVVGKWPESVTSRLDLVFPDAPFPSEGASDVEGIFPPPYYEWFQADKEYVEYRNFDACLEYIEDLILRQGPFDGLMGFSQGRFFRRRCLGMQAKGRALTKVPKIKSVMIIAGAKFRSPAIQEVAYSERIPCPSLHFLGEHDFLREYGEVLLDSYVEPLVIRHPKGHTVPRLLDQKSLETMTTFLRRIEEDVSRDILSETHQQVVEL